MTISDLSTIFEGLAKGLEQSLKKSDYADLQNLNGLFRRFSALKVSDFLGVIEAAIVKEKNSLPVLIERLSSFLQGKGVSAEEAWYGVESLPPADLKKVAKALGKKAGTSKVENLKILHQMVFGNASVASPDEELEIEVEHWQKKYRSLQERVRDLTIPQIKSEFEPFRNLKKEVLEGISRRYSLTGSKGEIVNRLLDMLEKMRISYEDRRIIAGVGGG